MVLTTILAVVVVWLLESPEALMLAMTFAMSPAGCCCTPRACFCGANEQPMNMDMVITWEDPMYNPNADPGFGAPAGCCSLYDGNSFVFDTAFECDPDGALNNVGVWCTTFGGGTLLIGWHNIVTQGADLLTGGTDTTKCTILYESQVNDNFGSSSSTLPRDQFVLVQNKGSFDWSSGQSYTLNYWRTLNNPFCNVSGATVTLDLV